MYGLRIECNLLTPIRQSQSGGLEAWKDGGGGGGDTLVGICQEGRGREGERDILSLFNGCSAPARGNPRFPCHDMSCVARTLQLGGASQGKRGRAGEANTMICVPGFSYGQHELSASCAGGGLGGVVFSTSGNERILRDRSQAPLRRPHRHYCNAQESHGPKEKSQSPKPKSVGHFFFIHVVYSGVEQRANSGR